ncbi:MAG: triose-phosphate isomerase [Candidatus Delongbacteria bacterium]|nr:triose-phosphate isomerase [Candidatus Delongbacteria bacterium]
MRKALIAGNWKMYKTLAEAREFVQQLKTGCSVSDDREVLICPPALYIQPAVEWCRQTPIQVGAQNCAANPEGAYTGEISPAMLASVNATHVILGHSERREYYGETNAVIAAKIKLTVQYPLITILCVGEKLDQREQGQEKNVVKTQLTEALSAITPDRIEKLVVAYEPVWAIGTGKTATPAQAQDMHRHIRQILAELYGSTRADQIRILYGGSIKPENIDELMSMPDIDGGLVGGASLKVDSFLRIINFNRSKA